VNNLFNLSDLQLELQSSARKFTKSIISPNAAVLDETESFPDNIVSAAYENGFINLLLPDELGGTNLSIFDSCIVLQELASGCAGVATSLVANDLALLPILIGGTPEQKIIFIRDLLVNKKLASFCLTEPEAGSDAASLRTRAEKVEGGYLVSGSKQWISNGGVAENFTLFATQDPSKLHKGISCFVVPSATQGVSVGSHERKLGQRCSNTVSINFDNVFIPKENLIGNEGEGFKIAMKTLDLSRPLTAIIAVGIAQAAFEHSMSYSQERKQFNQTIGSFQSIQFMLADMATNINAARLLTLEAAYKLDSGANATLQSSMAKRFAADMAMSVTTDAVQIFGGYGYSRDYPVEKLMRDAKLLQIYEGTSQIQRLVIYRELYKKSLN
jgi:acyl-CoA dehydrogenase